MGGDHVDDLADEMLHGLLALQALQNAVVGVPLDHPLVRADRTEEMRIGGADLHHEVRHALDADGHRAAARLGPGAVARSGLGPGAVAVPPVRLLLAVAGCVHADVRGCAHVDRQPRHVRRTERRVERVHHVFPRLGGRVAVLEDVVVAQELLDEGRDLEPEHGEMLLPGRGLQVDGVQPSSVAALVAQQVGDEDVPREVRAGDRVGHRRRTGGHRRSEGAADAGGLVAQPDPAVLAVRGRALDAHLDLPELRLVLGELGRQELGASHQQVHALVLQTGDAPGQSLAHVVVRSEDRVRDDEHAERSAVALVGSELVRILADLALLQLVLAHAHGRERQHGNRSPVRRAREQVDRRVDVVLGGTVHAEREQRHAPDLLLARAAVPADAGGRPEVQEALDVRLGEARAAVEDHERASVAVQRVTADHRHLDVGPIRRPLIRVRHAGHQSVADRLPQAGARVGVHLAAEDLDEQAGLDLQAPSPAATLAATSVTVSVLRHGDLTDFLRPEGAADVGCLFLPAGDPA